jgi:ppGpp synthetase/RelA/SpoT-type nucleotidyltranferase
MTDLAERYKNLFEEVLVPVANSLEQVLAEWLRDCPRIDRVSARAKSPERFIAKAEKRTPGGEISYQNPMQDIQDQVGARVTVLFLSDVETVSAAIEKYLKPREIAVKAPDNDSEFSYFGKHFILELPADAIPPTIQRAEVPDVFELQIKTLFQHAWSESNHDLGYKPRGNVVTPDQRRLLAYSSAQAWGADRVFDQLHGELH